MDGQGQTPQPSQPQGTPVAAIPALGQIVPTLAGNQATPVQQQQPTTQPTQTPPPPAAKLQGVPIYSPQGQFGHVVQEHYEAALQSGGQRALPVISPQGQSGYVPEQHYTAAIQSGGQPDVNALFSNPNREGMYSMVGPQGQTIDVPFSKVRTAQSMQFAVQNPQGYAQDLKASQQQPGFLSRLGQTMQQNLESNTQLVPHAYAATPGGYLTPGQQLQDLRATVQNVGSGVAKVVGSTPGFMKDVAKAAVQSVHTGDSSELLRLLDPEPMLRGVADQFMAQAKTDPQAAMDNLLGTIGGVALMHKVSEAVGGVKDAAANRVLQTAAGITPSIRGTILNLVDADDALRKAGQGYVEDLQDAAQSNADKLQKHADKTQDVIDATNAKNTDKLQDAALKHQQAVAAVQADNAQARAQWQQKVQRTNEENAAAQQALNLRRDTAQQFNDLTQQIADRQNALDAAALKEVNAHWDNLRANITESVDLTPVQKVIEAQANKMDPASQTIFRQILREGSAQDMVDQFRQKIVDQWKTDPNAPRRVGEGTAGGAPATAQGHYNSYDELPDNLKSVVDDDVSKQMLVSGIDPDEGAIDFARLHSWVTEMNYKRYHGGDMPGNVRAGLREVFNAARKAEDTAAQDAGQYQNLVNARDATKDYKEAFGRPEKQRLNKDDLLLQKTNPEKFAADQRQKQIAAVAKFDPTIQDAYDQIDDIKSQLGGMMSEDQLRKSLKQPPLEPVYKQEPTPPQVKLAKPNLPKPPQLDPGPSPLRVDAIKNAAVEAAAQRWSSLDKWQIKSLFNRIGWIALSGEMLYGHRGGFLGGAIGAFAPMVLGKIIDRPAVKAWLSEGPTAQDLATLGQVPQSDLIRIRDTVTNEAVSMADAGEHFKLSPKTARWLGPANTEKVTQALIRGALGRGAAGQAAGTPTATVPAASLSNAASAQPPTSQQQPPQVAAQ